MCNFCNKPKKERKKKMLELEQRDRRLEIFKEKLRTISISIHHI